MDTFSVVYDLRGSEGNYLKDKHEERRNVDQTLYIIRQIQVTDEEMMDNVAKI